MDAAQLKGLRDRRELCGCRSASKTVSDIIDDLARRSAASQKVWSACSFPQ